MYDFFVNLKGEIVLKGGRDIFVSDTLCMFFITPIIFFSSFNNQPNTSLLKSKCIILPCVNMSVCVSVN